MSQESQDHDNTNYGPGDIPYGQGGKKPTCEEIRTAMAGAALTGNDICTAIRHLGAGDPRWDWLSQEAAIMIETQAEHLRERTTERDYHLRIADKLAERVRELETQVEQLKAVIVADTHVLLTKRPVAFRLPEHDGWIILQNEEAAQIESDHRSVSYQGLYVRDGS